MTTRNKIDKKGYRVTANIGYRNGEQTIVSYTAVKVNGSINDKVTKPNLTQLYKAL